MPTRTQIRNSSIPSPISQQPRRLSKFGLQIRIQRGLIGRKQLYPHTGSNLRYCAFPSLRAPPPVVTYLSGRVHPRSRQPSGGSKFGLHIRNQRCLIGRKPVRRYIERRIVDPSPRPFSSQDSGSARHCPSWFYHLFPNFWKRRFQIRFCAIHSSSSFGEILLFLTFWLGPISLTFWTTPNPTPHFPTLGILFWGTIYPFSSPTYVCVLYLVNS